MKATKDTGSKFRFKPVAPEAKQGLVNEVFARVAPRYDLMNDLMSGRPAPAVERRCVVWLAPPKSARPFALLDVAGGTGDIASRFLQAPGTGARAVICDISAEMLRGRARAGRGRMNVSTSCEEMPRLCPSRTRASMPTPSPSACAI